MYKVKVYFPNGKLLKECEATNILNHYSGIGICTGENDCEWHYGMIWIAEVIRDEEVNSDRCGYTHTERDNQKATIFSYGGKKLKEVEGVYFEPGYGGDVGYLHDCKTGKEKYIFVGPVSLVNVESLIGELQ